MFTGLYHREVPEVSFRPLPPSRAVMKTGTDVTDVINTQGSSLCLMAIISKTQDSFLMKNKWDTTSREEKHCHFKKKESCMLEKTVFCKRFWCFNQNTSKLDTLTQGNNSSCYLTTKNNEEYILVQVVRFKSVNVIYL